MSLRYGLLGLLDNGPASGYELTRWFERSLQQYAWHAQQSHIYPELKRLAGDGLVIVVDEGPRGRRTYAITDAGRQALRAWLTSPGKPRAVRDEHALRMFLLSTLDIPDARALTVQYLAEATEELAKLRTLIDEIDAQPHPAGHLRFGRLAAEYGLHHYEALQHWAHWVLGQLEQAERRSGTDRTTTTRPVP